MMFTCQAVTHTSMQPSSHFTLACPSTKMQYIHHGSFLEFGSSDSCADIFFSLSSVCSLEAGLQSRHALVIHVSHLQMLVNLERGSVTQCTETTQSTYKKAARRSIARNGSSHRAKCTWTLLPTKAQFKSEFPCWGNRIGREQSHAPRGIGKLV